MDTNTVTVARMKEIERQADESGLSYYEMMENAGKASFHIIEELYPQADTLLVFCGKGNNGGDGLVVARLAALSDRRVFVILVEGEPVTEDAYTNLCKLPKLVNILKIEDVNKEVLSSDNSRVVVVDALYGTGFHGRLRENGRIACDIMNFCRNPIVSLDIPSGCDADNAIACDGAIKAEVTVVFHAYKNVHIPPLANCGECRLVGIGIK